MIPYIYDSYQHHDRKTGKNVQKEEYISSYESFRKKHPGESYESMAMFTKAVIGRLKTWQIQALTDIDMKYRKMTKAGLQRSKVKR